MPENTLNGMPELFNATTNRKIDDIVTAILDGMVIPIVGYDFMYNDPTNPKNDFLQWLIKKHAESEKRRAEPETVKFIDEIINSEGVPGYRLINEYYNRLDSIQKRNFKRDIADTIKKERTNLELIPESFKKLVSITSFKIFINCTIINILQSALNSVRATGTSSEDLQESYDVKSYSNPNPEDLVSEKPTQAWWDDIKKPVIYNLFGTYNANNDDYIKKPEYVITDADYIELIYDLLVNKSDSFQNLLAYLKEANLLFLGCNFQDWFFRFFMRACVGDRLDEKTTAALRTKTVIDSLSRTDENRTIFINNYHIDSISMDSNLLMNEIYLRIERRYPKLIVNEINNRVFISYFRKDQQVAEDIKYQFDLKYISHFLDTKDLEFGDDLNKEISSAIDRCCIFLPIISKNIEPGPTAAKLPYVWREWIYANSRLEVTNPETIIPVFKNFVDTNMLLPDDYNIDAQFRKRILGKDNTIGFKFLENKEPFESQKKYLDAGIFRNVNEYNKLKEIYERGNLIDAETLTTIKERQFKSRIS